MIRTSLTQWTQSAGHDLKGVIELSFPVNLVCTLTGATSGQLAAWRKGPSPLLAPEVAGKPRALYSFRDVVALRTVASLRKEIPLQRIRRAFQSLQDMDLTDHPSRYTLTTDGTSVFLVEGEAVTDLVKSPRQQILVSLEDVFKPFINWKGEKVVDFLNPRPHLEVRETRMGGWPTIRGTRVAYGTIANLVKGGEVSAEYVSEYFPTVSPMDVADAVDFDRQVESVGRRA
ncbi:DUF433 domain-containing protein [Rhodococcus erythropolis]|uniref:DUF433 domain-containing protein n=1 Tax=Rhodococcus erythropolis TaxID=1833 RepID=UPI0038299528|nr:DUF433 domain-containing protein [Rhodococcus erythropolis]